MASPLPSPGQLIIENVELLAGSPDAFRSRYGYTLTPTTFSRPGATGPAAAVLHFLLCIIDAEVAQTQFKPCFPILDRQQERDFRSVVDSQLSVLEKTKLLPVGAARKSVVASAGGDRFVDLLWSLSSLAVQQACLRHSPYGHASRLRLLSQQARTESNLSQQSSVRSVRSFMSSSVRPDRPDPSRQRRFLGVGMLTASQQRAKDAEELRARIDAERAALARTADMGKREAKTWATEAESLREKIGEFEAKVRRLKGQLADMGFDENGVDIRGMAPEGSGDGARTCSDSSCSQIPQSSSGEDLGEVLKTSPIESMESGSSVDELPEPGEGCEDIAADLSRLMTFAAETREMRAEVDEAFPCEKTEISIPRKAERKTKSKDVVDFVRAATAELEEATTRMNQMREARLKAEAAQSPIESNEGSPRVEKDVQPVNSSSLGELVNSALARHKEVVESSRNLSQAATELTKQSQTDMRKLSLAESPDSSQTIDPVASVSKPTWLTEAAADASKNSLTESHPRSSQGTPSSSRRVNTAGDVKLMAEALQSTSPRKGTSSASENGSTASSRRKKKSKHPGSRHTRTGSSASVSHETFSPPSTPQGMANTEKTPRSVRFADLPPSYSANRPLPNGVAVRSRMPRCTTEVFPKAPRRNVTADGNEKIADIKPTKYIPKATEVKPETSGDVDVNKVPEPRRRPERREPGRRESAGGQRPAYSRRVNSIEERLDGQRGAAGASQFPSRVPRQNTPRHMVRRKEAITRSVAPSGTGVRVANSPKKVGASASGMRSRENSANITPRPEVERVSAANTVAEQPRSERAPRVEVVKEDPMALPVADELNEIVEFEKADDIAQPSSRIRASMGHIDAVPKRLFQTPEPSSMSSANRGASRTNIFVRKAEKSAASSIQSKKSTTMTSVIGERKESRASSIPASPKRSPTVLSSTSTDRYSAAPNMRLSSGTKPPLGRMSKGDGFFAGETANWQQNVRTRSSLGDQLQPTARPSVESFVSASKEPGRSSSKGWSGGSPKKSRVQSLRARLAAVLK